MKPIYILIGLFGLMVQGLSAQDNPLSIQKKAQLDTTKDFSKRIRILTSLSYNYGLSHTDSALKYANQTLAEAKAAGDPKEIGKAIGVLGILHEKKGDFDKALEYQKRSFEILEEMQDEEGLAGTTMQFGNINLHFGKYEKALQHYFHSLEKFEQLGNQARIAGNLNNIGVVYLQKKEYEKAREYLSRALKVNQKLGNLVQEGRCYNNLGLIQVELNDYQGSLELFAKAESIYVKQGNKRGLGSVLTNKAETYSLLGQHAYAQTLYQQGQELNLITNNKQGQVDNYSSAGLAYQRAEKHRLALSQFRLAQKVALEIQSLPNLIDIHLGAAQSWFKTGRADSAYVHHLAYTALKDSIFNLEKETRIQELEGNYAMAKKEQAIEALSHKNELQVLQLAQNKTYLIGAGAIVAIIFLSLVILLLYFSRFRIKTSQKTSELEQKLLRSQMNPHFIYNSLNSIQHFIYTHQTEEAGTYLAKFAELIRMILESSRDEAVSLEKEIKLLKVYLELQKLRFEELFDYELEIDPALNLEMTQVPPMLAQPFIENSIEHAFQGIQNGGLIKIKFSKKGEQVLFEIEDNGIGIQASKDLKQGNNHRSLAMDITRERLDFLKMTRKFNAQFKVIDKQKENDKESGTLVRFFLPEMSW